MAQINQPMFILRDDTDRFQGRTALRMNILASQILASIVRTTLGPKGMDKMLVDKMGDVVVTNDGATILQEMDIAHPAAKMLVEIARKQEHIVGDGTTTVVIIAGELLKKAQELIEDGTPVPTILLGYRLAVAKALEILFDISIDARDEETLFGIAKTAMTGKGSDYAKDELAELLVQAALKVEEGEKLDKKLIKIHRINGGSIEDSEIVDGIFIDKGRMSEAMPAEVHDAKIALMKYPLELKDLDNAKVDFTDPLQMQAFLDNEQEMLKDIADKIIDSGCNVLFCQKGIDDVVAHYLTKAGVMAFKRVKNTDVKRIMKATGAELVTNIEDLTSDVLGTAGYVHQEKVFDQILTFIEDCEDPKASSILIRGSTRHVSSEIERAMEDALGVVAATVEDGKVVIGGGAPEIEIARQLRAFANTVSGREQLAIMAFAEALEIVPKTLAENAGLDTIDLLVELRASHEKDINMGLDVFEGKVVDMKERGVVEPQRVKKQAIQSAQEACEMILRIDDLVAAAGALEKVDEDENLDNSGMPPAPGMGGMGGMPGGMPPMM
ncbi:thermosome subunit alpha [uncultured Methanobrevibacter sp.]|uniref:thermosome subunit alpha n=1 Tax=uncultured Methanobrevibacter sp. TaxID=253161 RepID=UPI0026065A87